jgi:DnaK suppressor protein
MAKKTGTTKKTNTKAKSKPAKTTAAKAPAVKKKAPAAKSPAKKTYSQKDLQHFRNIILEQRKEIMEEIATLRESMMDTTTGEYTGENSSYSIHMADQGGEQMDREITFLFASREGKYLRYLEEALQRIESGQYGICRDCGSLINKERLEAVPIAQQCIKCKTSQKQSS